MPQPEYVNAVVSITTGLTPLGLLAVLQGIEHAHGRVRDGTRWGPRTLDLDLLLYDDLQLRSPKLILPHPELVNRAFVLVPLAEIAPTALQVPGLGHPQDLLAALGDRKQGDLKGVRLIPADRYATPIPPAMPGDLTTQRPLYS
jgi:2-amino-4-hydroxy-6-hydroxymethyldihydropteridine diphosphokinase